ncbi:MAG: type II secretion system major pseudopilin GspG [Alphaproteobacteria bacterium]|nr:type II secretion system major pseudopilin GspG [Pseudomonadota bacterium]
MIRKTVSRLRRSQGFTLIELLVALAILALIAGIAVPQVLKYLASAKTDTAQIQIESLGGALDLYRLDVGRYPAESEGLKALVERSLEAERWNGPYIKKADGLIDPWGNPYIYDFPGEHGDYDLHSLGADGAEGGEDEDQDVVSW